MRKQSPGTPTAKHPLRRFFPVMALLLMMPLGKLHAADQHGTRPDIRIASSGWGNTDTADLKLVLESVAQTFGQHFPHSPLNSIDVRPGAFGPVVLYERAPDDAYQVKLSARDGRWFQFVYQFAHELCHIYSNFDRKRDEAGQIVTMNQWFEESICEAASLFVLRSLALSWSEAQPDSLQARHAGNLRAYAEYFLKEPHRRLPGTQTLAAWYRKNQHHLATNPYLRHKNELVANILLPYFEHNPGRWEAISYLNPDAERANMVFDRYLDAWMDACPEQLKDVIAHLIETFESVTPITVGASRLAALGPEPESLTVEAKP